MTIYEKLSAIQVKLNAPKKQYNSYGRYNYRSCEDILEGLKPHLEETKTAVTVNDEIVLIGERYYVKATATLHDCESDKSVSNTAYAREELTKKGMDASQITGSTSSYARKYALMVCSVLMMLRMQIQEITDRKKQKNKRKQNQKLKILKILLLMI